MSQVLGFNEKRNGTVKNTGSTCIPDVCDLFEGVDHIQNEPFFSLRLPISQNLSHGSSSKSSEAKVAPGHSTSQDAGFCEPPE